MGQLSRRGGHCMLLLLRADHPGCYSWSGPFQQGYEQKREHVARRFSGRQLFNSISDGSAEADLSARYRPSLPEAFSPTSADQLPDCVARSDH